MTGHTKDVSPREEETDRANLLDIEECMKTAEELVTGANIDCISGEPDVLCTAPAMNARMQKKDDLFHC